jgi:hypothetical protein
MRLFPFFLKFCLVFVATASGAVVAQNPAGSREYRILQRTDSGHFAETLPEPSKPLILAKPPQPYAYGWFGSKPSVHWHRQFGNRRSYTQWTLK